MIHLSSIQFNIQSEFHMLRHFEMLDDTLQQKLLENNFTPLQLQQELSLSGSRFFSFFATDITQLLNRILHQPYKQSIGLNGNLIIESTFSEKEYPNGIGTKAVIPLNHIASTEQKSIFYENNRNYPIAHLLVNDLLITQDCTLILKPITNGYLFISAFPGEQAMPIPNEKMNVELFDECKDYWSKHIFLKFNSK